MVALYFIISWGTASSIAKDEEESLSHKFEMMNSIVAEDMNDLVEDIVNLGSNPFDIDLSSPSRSSATLKQLASAYGIDNIALLTIDGTPIASTANSVFESVSEKKAIASAVANKPIAVTTAVHDMFLITAAGRAITDDGTPIILVFQEIISSEAFLSEYARLLECELTVFSGNKRIASTMKDASGRSMTGTLLDNQEILDVVYKDNKVYSGIVEFDGNVFQLKECKFNVNLRFTCKNIRNFH